MALLISYPDELSLSQNLKKIVASADSNTSFILYKGEEVILDEIYYPNESGNIEIDIRDIVTGLLSVNIPTTDVFQQSNAFADFSVTLGDQAFSFRAVKGGIANDLVVASQWLKENFLTWQPQKKMVTYNQPEWLTYYAVNDANIICKLYNQDGSYSLHTLASLSSGQCASINTQFSRIINIDDTAKYAYYDIWAEDSTGVRISYVQRYFLRNDTRQERYFIFTNSVGGIDAVSFTGDRELEAESDHQIAQINDLSIQSEQILDVWYNQSTGYKSIAEAKWLQDFFTAEKRYIVDEGNIIEIVIQSSSLTDTSSEFVKEYSFNYRKADKRPLMNLSRDIETPENIEFPTAEQIFFLAPRLNDFAEPEINPYMIIPVQLPYENVWYRVSIGNIQQLMKDIAAEEMSGNIHQHWNKDALDAIIADELGDLHVNNKSNGSARNFSTGGKFFGNGFSTKVFASGLTGVGANVDEQGNGEFESMTIRKFLEVPELRFNRVDIKVGDKWRAPGGGVIERVQPDSNADTGTAWLKLEDGEIGAIAVGDICMGIFHNFTNKGNNATADYDDGKGNREFAGFCTVYFRITEVSDYTDLTGTSWHHKQFRYALRPTSENWSKQLHPMQFMNFVVYGSFSNTDRQTSAYETRTYTRFLIAQNSWEIGIQNIAKQEGDLTNLRSAFNLDLSGYSSYQRNMYVTGVIKQVKEDGTPIYVANDRGQWVNGITAEYYDRFSYNGGLWLCVNEDGTNQAPSESDTSWLLQVRAGSSITPFSSWKSNNTPYPINSILSFYNKVFISTVETSEPPFPLITDNNGNYVISSDGGYIIANESINSSWELLLDAPELTKGEDGTSVEARFSSDGTNWHTTQLSTDIYIQMRNSDGDWGAAIKIVGEAGADGQDGPYTVFEFANSTSLTEAPTSGWTDGPELVPEGHYAWMRFGTVVPPNTAPESWVTRRLGGEKGNGIKTITEYYQVSSSNTKEPTEWITTIPQLSEEDKYLWNYELIEYTDGTTISTNAFVMAMYSKDGNGIKSIINRYGLTNTADLEPETWLETMPIPTQEMRFLWNKTITEYTSSETTTIIRLLTIYGEKGQDGQSYNQRGAWLTEKMPAAVMDVFTMGGALWVATCVTSNPPLFTMLDAAGNRVVGNDGGYILTGEINSDEWDKLIESGKDGADGKDYEWIYTRNDTGEVPSAPASVQVDDYIPSGWTDNPSGVTESIPYEFASVRIKKDGLWGNYSTPALWAKFGKDGIQGLQGLQGEKGEQGIQGPAGSNGLSSYFHLKYADDANGTNMNETGGDYIGTYVDFIEEDSSDPKKYKWVPVKGAQGEKGEQGIQGINGANGQSSYLHLAYANSADGSEGFSISDSVGKLYIGIYIDFIEEDSTDYTKYKWSEIKGEKGDKGDQGEQGEKGDSVTAHGSWKTGLTIPKLGIVTMGGKAFISKTSTSNPPMFTMLDANGNRVIGKDGGYILTGEINSDEWDILAENGKDGAQGPQGIAGTDGIPGADGAPGIAGCIMRYAEWQDGYEWRNDESLTEGTRYIDMSFVRSTTSTTGWDVYKCLQTHISSQDNAPGNTAYWEEFSMNLPAIFTNIILASSAHIDLMQGNDLLIKKSDASVTAGMSGTQDGDKTRIWAGASSENKDIAPFAVNEDGVATAEMFRTARKGCRMEAQNGVISIFGASAKNIEFGVNDEGLAVLRYYDNDGTLLYDLGPSGLSAVKRANDSWMTLRLAYVGDTQSDIFTSTYWDIVQWPFHRHGTDYFQFFSGYIGDAYNDAVNNRRVYTAQDKLSVQIPDGWYVEVDSDATILVSDRETYIVIDGQGPTLPDNNPALNLNDPVYVQRVTRYMGGFAVQTIKTYFNIYTDKNEAIS